MSTAPVVPTIQSEVAALAHRHLSLTFGLVGTLVLLMALMGAGGYLGLRSFDAALAKQEVRDAQYQADRQTFLNTLQVHEAERTADAAKIADLEAQIKTRDSKPLPKPIQDGIKPDATAKTVALGLTEAYKGLPSFGAVGVDPAGNIALSLPQAQETIRTKVDLDKTQGDLKDTQAVVDLQKQANSSLTNDLGQCKALNVQANKDIDGYKKLAKRSRWQKFLAGAEKVGLLVVGGYVGHKI